MHVNACTICSGTIKRCGLVGVGVALLEEVCHCEGGFEVSYMLKLCPVHGLLLLLADQDVELSAPSSAQCLRARHHVLP